MPTENVMDQFSLKDHVALVTGGSRGLGLAMAGALAQAGARVVLAARKASDCEAAAASLAQENGGRAEALPLDVTREDQVDKGFETLMSRHGRLDVVINAAGVNVRNLIEDCKLEDFENVLRINLTGTWLVCRAAARVLKPRKYGSVINIGSALSKVALPMRTPYCSSKFGVIGLTQALALEWAESGVRCNAICPGPFLTEMNKPLLKEPERAKMVLSQTALNRWGEMKEITGAALYLASPASTYVTGSSLYVDAGWTA